MQWKARIFKHNGGQAVQLPRKFQFDVQEVFIRKDGNNVILSPLPMDWSSYRSSAPIASASFMDGVEELPAEDR